MSSPTRSYTPSGIAAATGTAWAWAAGIMFIKLIDAPFVVASFWRHGFAVPVLVVAWIVAGRGTLPWRAGAVGGLLFAVHQVFHFGALHHSTAAVVTILFSLQPVIVGAAGRRVTGEGTTPRFYLWAVVAAAGSALLVWASTAGAQSSPLGTALAVGNLLVFSAYYLASKRARETVTATSWLLVMTVVSGLLIGALVVVTGGSFASPRADDWLLLVALALIPGTLGHLLITWAHPRIHAAASSAVILAVPVLASIGAAVLLDEPFGPLHAAGGLVALAGAGMALRHLPPPAAAEAAETYGEVVT